MDPKERDHPPEANGPPAQQPPSELHITRELVQRAKEGDSDALDRLIARYRQRLVRWATGRLPLHARSLLETSDLVHDTLLGAIERMDKIEIRGPGFFEAYVRRAVLNRIQDQIRWAQRRKTTDVAQVELVDGTPSPLDNAVGSDLLQRYEASLERLSEEERRLIHLRLELYLEYSEIASIMEKPSRDAARMAVKRAFRRLAELMDEAPQS